MCVCTPNKRTPCCKNCPFEHQIQWGLIKPIYRLKRSSDSNAKAIDVFKDGEGKIRTETGQTLKEWSGDEDISLIAVYVYNKGCNYVK